MCGLSTVVTPAGASLTMYREIRSYANSIWDDNNNNNNIVGGNIGCQDTTSSWHSIGFHDGSIIAYIVEYSTGPLVRNVSARKSGSNY